MSNRARSEVSKELPLETTAWTEKDEKTGEDVHVTSLRRGVLRREMRRFASAHTGFAALVAEKTTRQGLEDYCDFLRQQLAKAALPTDTTRSWIKRGTGDWEVYDAALHDAKCMSARLLAAMDQAPGRNDRTSFA